MPRRKQNPQSLKQTVSTAIKKIVWRVAIYIRLSKDDGNDESYSVKNQRERLNDTLEQLMLDEDGIEFVGYYIEKSVIVGIKSRGLLRHKALLV